jgi:hypothetical protein
MTGKGAIGQAADMAQVIEVIVYVGGLDGGQVGKLAASAEAGQADDDGVDVGLGQVTVTQVGHIRFYSSF